MARLPICCIIALIVFFFSPYYLSISPRHKASKNSTTGQTSTSPIVRRAVSNDTIILREDGCSSANAFRPLK